MLCSLNLLLYPGRHFDSDLVWKKFCNETNIEGQKLLKSFIQVINWRREKDEQTATHGHDKCVKEIITQQKRSFATSWKRFINEWILISLSAYVQRHTGI